ncbi:MAG: response regulator [Pseudobdellovibrionaceae bacterium]
MPHSRILIVDDDMIDRQLMKRCFTNSGEVFHIDEVESAAEAIARIQKDAYQCVFLDYFLPDKNGLEFLESVYNPATDLGPCPIVLITGEGNEKLAIKAIRSGAQDYIIKDHITVDALMVSLAKAQETFELKLSRNKAIEQLVNAQKMESLGKLTGGIAHDFNNLLQVIIGNADLLVNGKIQDHESIKRKAGLILRAAEQGSELTARMLAFAREQTLMPTTFDLNDALEDMREMLEMSAGQGVEIDFKFGKNLSAVTIDKVQLQTALINFTVNARDAMSGKGHLFFETHERILDKSFAVFEKQTFRPGRYVEIVISDTGIGMSRDIKDKIFDPFFTTKAPGEGTGLGLSMVFGFIAQSGGLITVYSEENLGSTFHIYLPIDVEEKPLDSAAPREIVPLRTFQIKSGASGRILVVEDDANVRDFVSMALKAMGYSIRFADTGEAALEILRNDPAGFQLLFSDVILGGGMNGVMLAESAQKMNKGLKILLCSGYTGEALEKKGYSAASRFPLLNKPYRVETLEKKVRSLLD